MRHLSLLFSALSWAITSPLCQTRKRPSLGLRMWTTSWSTAVSLVFISVDNTQLTETKRCLTSCWTRRTNVIRTDSTPCIKKKQCTRRLVTMLANVNRYLKFFNSRILRQIVYTHAYCRDFNITSAAALLVRYTTLRNLKIQNYHHPFTPTSNLICFTWNLTKLAAFRWRILQTTPQYNDVVNFCTIQNVMAYNLQNVDNATVVGL